MRTAASRPGIRAGGLTDSSARRVLAGAGRGPEPEDSRAVLRDAAPQIAATVSEPTWQLTDRGVAVLLVAGLMIMVAALTVVGLTAITVTGEGYRATVSSSLPR